MINSKTRRKDSITYNSELNEEFEKILSQYNSYYNELQQLEIEIKKQEAVLNEKHEYSTALASYLDKDTDLLIEESQMRDQLSKVENSIESYEKILQNLKSKYNPSVLFSLNKEKSFLLMEIYRGNESLRSAKSQKDIFENQLAACSVHSRYLEFKKLNAHMKKLNHKLSSMRSLSKGSKRKYDEIKLSQILLQSPEAAEVRKIYRTGIDIRVNNYFLNEKLERLPQKHKIEMEMLKSFMEELDIRVKEAKVFLGIDTRLNAEAVSSESEETTFILSSPMKVYEYEYDYGYEEDT